MYKIACRFWYLRLENHIFAFNADMDVNMRALIYNLYNSDGNYIKSLYFASPYLKSREVEKGSAHWAKYKMYEKKISVPFKLFFYDIREMSRVD